MATAGRFFGTEAHDRALLRGNVGSSAAYWELVGAILTAAHLYRNALDRQERGRGTRAAVSLEVQAEPAADEVGDELALLRDFLSARGLTCPRCRAAVELRSADPGGAGTDAFDAPLTCRACGRAVPQRVVTDDLLSWIRSAG
jgi:hypothetical protein